jgi:hypothetical protein
MDGSRPAANPDVLRPLVQDVRWVNADDPRKGKTSPGWLTLTLHERWETSHFPVDDSAEAIDQWLDLQVTFLRSTAAKNRKFSINSGDRLWDDASEIVRDAWRIVEHLRQQGPKFAGLPARPRLGDGISLEDGETLLGDLRRQVTEAFAKVRPTPKKPGRKRSQYPHDDRILNAWQTGKHQTHKDLAETLELPPSTVKKAIERERGRRRRAADE